MSNSPVSPGLSAELIASVSAEAAARTAHHEAGHAVAAVARGGELLSIDLGYVDWSRNDASHDRDAGTRHNSSPQNAPFVTFAGPWAEATWVVEGDPEADFYDALAAVWDNNVHGDEAKYSHVVAIVEELGNGFGLPLLGRRPWERQWEDELEPLWPAVSEVARLLLDNQTATHEEVRAAIERTGLLYE